MYQSVNKFPQAVAVIMGNADNPKLRGTVKFYSTSFNDVLIEAELFGLPVDNDHPFSFHGMHIHEFGDCSDNFEHSGNHYNPGGKLHPYHKGDLLPLLSNDGYAWSAFIDGSFTINEIIGKSVIIHSNADDFTTQPSGNSGTKIGCGVIKFANVHR